MDTDGSITPEDALAYAGKILRDHIQLFINFDTEPEAVRKESPSRMRSLPAYARSS